MTLKVEEAGGIHIETSLSQSVTRAVQNYFNELKDSSPVGLYQLVMDEIEVPLLKMVMKYCRYNQSKAATLLGLSRGTLRSKLKKYFDEEYTK